MIYKITLRVKHETGNWCTVYTEAKTITAAISKAIEKQTEIEGNKLELVCSSASETDIDLV